MILLLETNVIQKSSWYLVNHFTIFRCWSCQTKKKIYHTIWCIISELLKYVKYDTCIFYVYYAFRQQHPLTKTFVTIRNLKNQNVEISHSNSNGFLGSPHVVYMLTRIKYHQISISCGTASYDIDIIVDGLKWSTNWYFCELDSRNELYSRRLKKLNRH